MMAPDGLRREAWQKLHDDFISTGEEMAGEWVVRDKEESSLTY